MLAAAHGSQCHGTDYDESDSDCGGNDCPRCGPGRRCTTSFDCASARCLQGICQ
jgi:hypothetical protein